MKNLVVLFVLFLGACQSVEMPTADADRIEWNPPNRYDFEYAETLIEISVSQSEVVNLCTDLFKEHNANIEVTNRQRGCAWVENESCTIIYLNEIFEGVTPTAVRRHEIGHCNGWSNEHDR